MKTNGIKVQQLVKVTNSGRISLTVSANMKAPLMKVFEFTPASHGSFLLAMRTELLRDVLTKYYTVLHLNRVNRVQLTRAQAYALWFTYAENDLLTGTIELAALMDQLHQKLISLPSWRAH